MKWLIRSCELDESPLIGSAYSPKTFRDVRAMFAQSWDPGRSKNVSVL